MKTFVSIILLVSTFSFSQNQNKIDLEKLKTKVYQLVNEERSNNDRKLLGLDIYLKKAADDHAKYIAKIQTLSHEQTDAKKQSPKERVYFYGGNSFVLVGENLLFTGIKDQFYTEADLDTLALKMFNLWKKSPNHLKNILDHQYFYTEIGFSIDWENKKIYAVQVFGTK
ncbi:CAP domain-containing protein [Flavobacterium lacisediminis]|uniref:CAP domain-containing protein n=1 Tax=Flavobacterium lacisediminis TaxID=2989705 RepID=A0ABT3EJU8_9FLAO|nr:CAP domain-containing protein [Flavobacterium lacisediminis]MCW1148853.1 CAP domain-containing protein [Flavobacterium lacisediminis]